MAPKLALKETTPVLVNLGLVATCCLGMGAWFNTRLSAIEIEAAEKRSQVNEMASTLNEVRLDVKSLLRKAAP